MATESENITAYTESDAKGKEQPLCRLRIIEAIEDEMDYAEAVKRMAHYDSSKLISEEEMNRRLGVTEDDLKDFKNVEIE